MRISLMIVFTWIGICRVSMVAGQATYTSTSSKAIRLYEEATKFYDVRENEKAFNLLKAAVAKDENFIEAYILMADIEKDNQHYESARTLYLKTFSINPDFFPINYFHVGHIELMLGNYSDAKIHFTKFLSYQRINADLAKVAQSLVLSCDFAMDALQHPVPFDPHNLGAAINSASDEYFPGITADDQQFLFTRSDRNESGYPGQEDFYWSKKVNNEWVTAMNIGPPINTPLNEGAPTLSADGQYLIFTGCDRSDGRGSCDLYVSRRIGERWSRPANLGPPINTKYWESQPSFSSDGKTLYFCSNRPGGFGDADIWQSTLNENGSWSNPVNLGPRINTSGKEESPYIHPDTKTLYFASDGHVGMGRSDIYVSKKDEGGAWSEPVNLGYPINTFGNENSLLVSGSGELAYFASDRKGGFGGLDIYAFNLYDKVRPEKITYMKGLVYDSRTKKPLGASFELIELASNKTVVESESNPGNGSYLVCLPLNKDYALNVSRSGYLFYSKHFSLTATKDSALPFIMDVPLQPIDTGLKVALNNVFFETGKFELKEESKSELQKLVSFLQLNKTLIIELGGHTDNVGDKQANLLLSTNRAKSVYDFLCGNGIAASRLSYKGYGDAQPVVPNDTPEHRQQNRRTEFKVLGK